MNSKIVRLTLDYLWRTSVVLSAVLLLASGEAVAQGAGSAEAMLEQAADHFANWRLAEAEEAYEQALRLNPSDPQVLAASALYERFEGDYGEALRLQQQAVELEPENPVHRFQLGITHKYMRNYEAATTALQSAIALAPTLISGRANLAIVTIARGNHIQALRHLQVAEQLARQQFEDNIPHWRLAQMAYAYSQLGRRQDVLRLFNELEQSEDPVSDVAWAMTYMAVGDYEEALGRLTTAIEEQEESDDFRQLLGDMVANTYSDPALDGPQFKAVLDGIWAGTEPD